MRGGCGFSWKNPHDVAAVYEDALPGGHTTVRCPKTSRTDTDDLTVSTAGKREWTDLASLPTPQRRTGDH